MPSFLLIQTAFIGDVVLATALAEKLHSRFPDAPIDFLVRKGNEQLFEGHPYIRKVMVWDKKKQKNRNLLKIILQVRKQGYDYVINPHRFATSGLITILSGAPHKIGFDKNPFSFGFSKKIAHIISQTGSGTPLHETERNQMLITDLTDDIAARPRLYPTPADYKKIRSLQRQAYICIAPTSVWFTKQFPAAHWIRLINSLPRDYMIFLLGAPGDKAAVNEIATQSRNPQVVNLTGMLSFLQSAALMKGATMNYVNDSAPMHFASSVNAPVTAVYCSTVPAFGFGPLSDQSRVVEIDYDLYCRPCGLHGYKACPEGHFKCAHEIKNDDLLWWISKTT